MSERLVNATQILLFGRVVDDVHLGARGGTKAPAAAESKSLSQKGAHHLLAEQVAAQGSCVVRIYAFAFEGAYYDLARPTLFVVHGKGDEVAATVEKTGLSASARDFAPDIRVWAYDKSDLSLRLDVETGTFEQILLELELIGDRTRSTFTGQNVRFSGQNVRFAGQNARLRGPRGDGNGDS